MKFVHAADLHIDSPLVGLSRYEGAPVERIRSATRRACAQLVQLCIDERVSFLLLAGDLFDGEWKDYSTGLFFVAQLARLKHAGVRVVTLRGNHDAVSHITRNLTWPDNTTEFGSRAAETCLFEDLGVAVHGRSYGKRAETSDLVPSYPEPVPGFFNIGLLHTCVSGRVGHEPYAPCSVDELRAKGYDYWALGHIHQREVLSEHPYIVFSGNLQGRHFRETGAKGATLVEVSSGIIESVTHRPLDVVRFADCELNVGADHDLDQVVDQAAAAMEEQLRAADGRTLVLRLMLRGACTAHSSFQLDPERWENEIRARAAEHSELWLAQVLFETQPLLQRADVQLRKDAVGQVLRAVHDAQHDPARLAELAKLFSDLAAKLPPEVRDGDHGLRVDDADTVRQALVEAERLLLVQLAGDAD
jgi:DNA repair protein SbcD/Mre11